MGTVGYKVTDELKLFFSTFDLAYWLFFSPMECAWNCLSTVSFFQYTFHMNIEHYYNYDTYFLIYYIHFLETIQKRGHFHIWLLCLVPIENWSTNTPL